MDNTVWCRLDAKRTSDAPVRLGRWGSDCKAEESVGEITLGRVGNKIKPNGCVEEMGPTTSFSTTDDAKRKIYFFLLGLCVIIDAMDDVID